MVFVEGKQVVSLWQKHIDMPFINAFEACKVDLMTCESELREKYHDALVKRIMRVRLLLNLTRPNLANLIRNNPLYFPAWHSSDTAKLFSPPVFKNKKQAKGYWF